MLTPEAPEKSSSETSGSDDPLIFVCPAGAFSQQAETRDAATIKELNTVPELAKSDQMQAAWDILDRYQDDYPDFDFIYVWQAFILQKNRQFVHAAETIRTGLEKARIKHVLCDRMGALCYETGKIPQAIQWWVKSCELMLDSDATLMWEPFLYLSRTALFLGQEKISVQLKVLAFSAAGNREIEFEPDADKKLETAIKSLAKDDTIKILTALGAEYAAPESCEKQPGPSAEQPADMPAKTVSPEKTIEKQAPVSRSKKAPFRPGIIAIIIVIFIIAGVAAYTLLFHSGTPRDEMPEVKTTQSMTEPSRQHPEQPASEAALPPEPDIRTQALPASAGGDTGKKPESSEDAPTEETTPLPDQKTEIPLQKAPHKEKLQWIKPKVKTRNPELKPKSDTIKN